MEFLKVCWLVTFYKPMFGLKELFELNVSSHRMRIRFLSCGSGSLHLPSSEDLNSRKTQS